MSDLLRFISNLLLLAQRPAVLRARLAGRAPPLADAAPLRDEVSTDEITPLPVLVHFDATLGRHPLTGFTMAGERLISFEALQARHPL